MRIKNCTFYYFDDIIKSEDFDLGNNLIDEKSYENILISYKTLINSKLCVLDSIKYMDLLEFMRELYIWHCLAQKNMKLFTTELDIL